MNSHSCVPARVLVYMPWRTDTSVIQVYFYTFTDVRWVLLLWVLELVGGGMPVREVLLWMYMAESVPEDGL